MKMHEKASLSTPWLCTAFGHILREKKNWLLAELSLKEKLKSEFDLYSPALQRQYVVLYCVEW